MNNRNFVNPNIISILVTDGLKDTTFYEMINIINSATIEITEDDVKMYLKNNMNKNHPGLIEELEILKNMYENIDFYCMSETEEKKLLDLNIKIKEYEAKISKYKYNPFSYKYFKIYIVILKRKLMSLIEIYNNLLMINEKKEVPSEFFLKLNELDITIDESGNILYSDIRRIVDTIIYNFNDLCEMLEKANDINTYLNFKEYYRIKTMQGELFPSEEVQILNFEYSELMEFIPLTEKQRKLLIEN